MSERINAFPPVAGEDARVLILGSFPSVKSREQEFFYGHPQNRFWKVMAALFGAPVPKTIEEKKALILDNGLALWDSIGSCEITGSSDASIRNAEPNDLRIITGSCDIRAIYCNGKKSLEVYNRYIEPVLGRPAEALPSTSPANAAWSLDRLIEAWAVVKDNLL
jgi:hypoxanthine-DNA glycosylase